MSETAKPTDQAFDLGDTPEGSGYRVLARKYRPQTFAELIGQDAMVQTLANAIARVSGRYTRMPA